VTLRFKVKRQFKVQGKTLFKVQEKRLFKVQKFKVQSATAVHMHSRFHLPSPCGRDFFSSLPLREGPREGADHTVVAFKSPSPRPSPLKGEGDFLTFHGPSILNHKSKLTLHFLFRLPSPYGRDRGRGLKSKPACLSLRGRQAAAISPFVYFVVVILPPPFDSLPQGEGKTTPGKHRGLPLHSSTLRTPNSRLRTDSSPNSELHTPDCSGLPLPAPNS
jgi:hypothetical protein